MLNWNQFDDTVECIVSLKQSTVPLVNIIVLDQASHDSSADRLEQLYKDDDQVFLIRNEKNLGFAGGMNVGIRRALHMGAEMTFVINNDTVVDKDCISHLAKALLSNPLAAVSGPAIMYHSNPEKIWLAGGYFNKLRMSAVAPDKGKQLRDISSSVRRVTFLTGCALLIRRNTFESVGLFDTSLFFYMDDVDYSLRVKNQGLYMYFVPEAKVWHKIDDVATDRTSPYVLYHLAKSNLIMLRKRFSGPEKWYGIILQFMIYTPFRFWQIIRGGSGWDSAFAWIRGLYHGVITKVREGNDTAVSLRNSRSPIAL